MNRAARIGAGIGVVLAAACARDSASPNGGDFDLRTELGVLQVQPIDSAGATFFTAGIDLTSDGTVVGTMVLGSVTNGFRWSKGTFEMLAPSIGGTQIRGGNNLGDVVGLANGRPMIWYAGDVNPTPIFPTDSVFVSALPFDVNDRREVYLFINGKTTAVWLQGSYRISPAPCTFPIGINNRGVVVYQTCNFTYNNWTLEASPFGALEIDQSARLQGRAECTRYRSSQAFAINDSNEVIGRTEQQADPTTPVDVWMGGGCENLSATFPGLSLRALNNRGLLGGTKIDGVDTSAVLAMNGTSAFVDDLLGQPVGQRTWHITEIVKINDSRQLLAFGYRYSNRRKIPLLLTPP